MSLAPITLFVYNRPQFTLRTLESILENDLARESELFIYADGPKSNANPSQLAAIDEVRRIIRSKKWCKNVTIIESALNKGLAPSIIYGVTETVNLHQKVIVIEDDVVVSEYFLRFMNEGLEKYKNVNNVFSLGSWNYYYNEAASDTYFIRLPDTIAWASWKRAWDHFEPDTQKIYNQLTERGLLNEFNLGGRFPYENMLKHQLEGKVNSWAIRWTATAFLNNSLTLYPSRSLSKHIGFGADSTHVKTADYNEDLVLADTPIQLNDIPLVNDDSAIDAFINFEKHIRPLKTSYIKKMMHLAKNLLSKVWLRKH
jgi:GR25 family glycosyltransferase involved in LPS biosynthesis